MKYDYMTQWINKHSHANCGWPHRRAHYTFYEIIYLKYGCTKRNMHKDAKSDYISNICWPKIKMWWYHLCMCDLQNTRLKTCHSEIYQNRGALHAEPYYLMDHFNLELYLINWRSKSSLKALKMNVLKALKICEDHLRSINGGCTMDAQTCHAKSC